VSFLTAFSAFSLRSRLVVVRGRTIILRFGRFTLPPFARPCSSVIVVVVVVVAATSTSRVAVSLLTIKIAYQTIMYFFTSSAHLKNPHP
jgi:hypothetical protein